MIAKPGSIRIVGGLWRGRTVATGTDDRIRPTAERTREALFDILGHGRSFRSGQGPLPRGVAVLDAFAGTGALGLEALSRGADHAIFLDENADAIKLIRANLQKLDAEDAASVLQRDALNPGRAPRQVKLVLLDPPYRSRLAGPALESLHAAGWLALGAIAVTEIEAAEEFAAPAGFELIDERRYGKARLVFLRLIGETLAGA
jgi:16S rRNA (guanine966-N2)-methyltransferase